MTINETGERAHFDIGFDPEKANHIFFRINSENEDRSTTIHIVLRQTELDGPSVTRSSRMLSEETNGHYFYFSDVELNEEYEVKQSVWFL